jgi:hypothetical protein
MKDLKKAIDAGRFVALLLDETTDSSNKAQLVVHLNWVLEGEFHTHFEHLLEIPLRKTAVAIDEVVVKYLKGKTCLERVPFLTVFNLPSVNLFCRNPSSRVSNAHRK